MPTASTIVLADGQATPVNHNFAPRAQVGPGNTTLVNDEASTSAGSMKLSLGFSSANSARKTNRVKISFVQPTEQTVDGVVRVAYAARFSIDIVMPEEMTLDERKDLGAFLKNALANSVVQGYITTLDPMY